MREGTPLGMRKRDERLGIGVRCGDCYPSKLH
jgi:hypothetical protein